MNEHTNAWAWLLASALTACARSQAAAPPPPSTARASASAPDAPSGSTPRPGPGRVQIPSSLERSCREICERSRRLDCENTAKCMPNCLAMGSLTPCTGEITAFYACLVSEPLPHWQCAPDGVAAVRPGFCDDEQQRTLTCMDAKMR